MTVVGEGKVKVHTSLRNNRELYNTDIKKGWGLFMTDFKFQASIEWPL